MVTLPPQKWLIRWFSQRQNQPWLIVAYCTVSSYDCEQYDNKQRLQLSLKCYTWKQRWDHSSVNTFILGTGFVGRIRLVVKITSATYISTIPQKVTHYCLCCTRFPMIDLQLGQLICSSSNMIGKDLPNTQVFMGYAFCYSFWQEDKMYSLGWLQSNNKKAFRSDK